MTFAGTDEPTELDRARDMFRTGLEHLIKAVDDGSLDQLGGMGVVGFMQDMERTRNLLSVVDHQIIAAAERLDLPTVLCQGSMRRVLTSVLGLSKREAARRVRAAEAVGPRTSMLGEALEPVRPVLAAAQREGGVSAEKVDIIERALEKVDRRGFDPTDIANGEALLTENARLFPPEDLKLLANRVVDGIDPDGTVPERPIERAIGATFICGRPGTVPMSGTSGSPGPPAPNSRPCWIRWRNSGSILPVKSTAGPTGSATTTPSKISATGNCGPATFRTPAASRRR